MFYNGFSYFCFFSLRDLRGPLADHREILPHSRKYVQFTNACPKMLGPAPQKLWFDFHCRSFASNLEQVANLLCAQANSAFYLPWDGE